MTLKLKAAIAAAGFKQGDFARAVNLSRPALSALCNHNILPLHTDRDAVQARVWRALRPAIDTQKALDALFEHENEKAPKRANASGPVVPSTQSEEETKSMLLQKQSLSPAARAHFKLNRDPFAECREPADMYLSPDMRYVREAMWNTVRHGGFLGVIGESGAGKTTLREELLERIARDDPSVIVCQPYVLAMEERDTVGKTLRSHHIAECIVRNVAPLSPTRSSPDARFHQLHEALRESARGGMRHVLMIEEAHCLPIPTLKHLKRYMELKDGMRPLLSIILIGQPELVARLNPHDPHVREVARRIELVHLPPLDQHLADYLGHRFKRIGVALENIIDQGGIEALRARLTDTKDRRGSVLYPLDVHNTLAAAMNAAASLGAPKVTRDIVAGGGK